MRKVTCPYFLQFGCICCAFVIYWYCVSKLLADSLNSSVAF